MSEEKMERKIKVSWCSFYSFMALIVVAGLLGYCSRNLLSEEFVLNLMKVSAYVAVLLTLLDRALRRFEWSSYFKLILIFLLMDIPFSIMWYLPDDAVVLFSVGVVSFLFVSFTYLSIKKEG